MPSSKAPKNEQPAQPPEPLQGEQHFAGISVSMIALAVSLASLLISSIQSYFAYDALSLGRKAMAMDRKVAMCIDFLDVAQPIATDINNPVTMMFAAIRTQQSDHPNLGKNAKLLGLGVLHSPYHDSFNKLEAGQTKANLLLPANTSGEMAKFVNLTKARMEEYFNPALDNAEIARQQRPIEHADIDAALKRVETLCGALVEKDAQ